MKFKVAHLPVTTNVFCILCIFLFCLPLADVRAQKVSAAADQSKIIIGDQVTLHLKVTDIDLKTTSIAHWFRFNDTANHIRVVNTSPIDSFQMNGTISFLQSVTLTSFDSGTWQYPKLFVVLQDKQNGEKKELSTHMDSLTVLPVDVSGMNDYHDVKSIIEVEKKPDYLLYIMIVLSAVVLFLLLRYILKKQKRPHTSAKVHNPEDALQNAITKLENLPLPKEESLQDAKVYYSGISEIAKHYFTQRFGVVVDPATTDQLILQTGLYLQKEPYKSNFYQLLRLADVVKFAKYIPSRSINQDAKKRLVNILTHIHEFNKMQIESNAE